MIMHNAEVDSIGDFLLKLELKGKESRMRTRFVKMLNDRMLMIQEEYQALIQDYAEKDQNNQPIMIEKDGRKAYQIADQDKLKEEYQKLMLEEWTIDQTAERKDMLESVRDSVLNCDLSFSGKDALEYDRICEIFESM